MAFEYLAAYKTFDSVEEMDKNVENHIAAHYYDLTEAERIIVFKLASHSLEHTGACHLKASTIAEGLEISTKTVYRSIPKLAGLGIIEKVPSTKLNGIKGANIYRILPYVPSSVSQREEADETRNDAVYEQVSENQPSSSFYLSKTSSLQEIYNSAHAEKEAHKEYMNEWQQMLYDFLYSLPLADQLKDELHKIVLASQIDNASSFHQAKEVIVNIARDIAAGTLTVTGTFRAVFLGAYNKRIERSNRSPISTSSVEENTYRERPVPLYDWLSERESTYEINDYTPIENWLEW